MLAPLLRRLLSPTPPQLCGGRKATASLPYRNIRGVEISFWLLIMFCRTASPPPSCECARNRVYQEEGDGELRRARRGEISNAINNFGDSKQQQCYGHTPHYRYSPPLSPSSRPSPLTPPHFLCPLLFLDHKTPTPPCLAHLRPLCSYRGPLPSFKSNDLPLALSSLAAGGASVGSSTTIYLRTHSTAPLTTDTKKHSPITANTAPPAANGALAYPLEVYVYLYIYLYLYLYICLYHYIYIYIASASPSPSPPHLHLHLISTISLPLHFDT
ncbi:hypothetical protein DFP73DRAFT_599024 [Morchella snyderi]|nr:hypothetical protein DFP73DRAFT_599024 [Morchella snyderi]